MPRTTITTRLFNRQLVATIVSLLLSMGNAKAEKPAVTTLGIRFFQITAELAETPAQRTRGLMGRTFLPPNHGMLFVFERPERQCFWMKNTPLPLSIAFVDDEGRIVNIEKMQPFSEQTHCSISPVRFALEMEQEWFFQRGVQPGEQVRGLPQAVLR